MELMLSSPNRKVMNLYSVDDWTRTFYPTRRYEPQQNIYLRRAPGDQSFECQLPPEICAELEAPPAGDKSSRPAQVPTSEQEIQAAIAWLKSQGYLQSGSAPRSLQKPPPPAGLVISCYLPTFAQTNTPDPQLRAVFLDFLKKEEEAWNNDDAVALGALFTQDAILVTDQGPIYGRQAIEKYYTDLFQKLHFSNDHIMLDADSPHLTSTAGNEMWATGRWSQTLESQNFGPIELKGFWSATKAREGGSWKTRMAAWNITREPPASQSPAASQ